MMMREFLPIFISNIIQISLIQERDWFIDFSSDCRFQIIAILIPKIHFFLNYIQAESGRSRVSFDCKASILSINICIENFVGFLTAPSRSLMRRRRFRTVALLVREWSAENERLRFSFLRPTNLNWDSSGLGVASFSEPSSEASKIVSKLVGLRRGSFLLRYNLMMSFSDMSDGLRLDNLRGRLMVRRLIPWSEDSPVSGRVRRVLR